MEESTYNSQFAIRNSQFARRGSALLIVLGMLSFMVVSAVAFSIFMRQGRLPSSFLRQRILARQLVKAGLSHAMSDIDAAIGDDPYPNEYRVPEGGGAGTYLGETHGWANNSQKNYWRNRVFMGQRGDGYQDDDENAHLKSTVSTFPLEGLAYIPPPLVNTVRYWSRRSPAATWKNLDYDSGRYAFTAVNVSDYLDINRLKANVMRDSSPEHRLSLAYLFENTDHSDWGSVKPSDFDKKTKSLESGQFGPLVSLADYNMALSSDAGGPLSGCGFLSQFCEFIKSPPSGAEFYTDETQARMQKFITGSWYPGEAAEQDELVLYDSEQPPFRSTGKGIADISSGLVPLMKNDTVSPVWNKIKQYLNLAERAALRDYVDEDNVPTSLALPTIERTPQLVGLMVKPYGFQPNISELTPLLEPNYGGDPKKRATKRVWKLGGFQNPQAVVQAAGVFPFKRTSGLSGNTSFPVQVLMKAYLVEKDRADFTLRAETSGLDFRPTTANDWRADNGLGSQTVGFISLFGSGTATVTPGKSEQDALQVNIPPITLNSANAGNFVRPLFGWITIEQQDEEGSWSQIPGEEGSHYDNSRFGEVGSGNLFYLNGQGQLTAAGEGASLKWQCFVWVRILDGNDTVDMFPANMLDDATYNGVNADLGPLRAQIGDTQRTPIVPVAGPAAFQLDQATFLGSQNGHAPGDGDPGETLVAYCNDPRYNFAPEDWWFVTGGSGVTAQQWYSDTQSYRDGGDYRANDLFQFVSNQGYLQSMGELQFLPLVRKNYDDFTLGNEIQGTFFKAGGQYDGVKRTSAGSAANQSLFWKSRFAFGRFSDHSQSEQHCPYEWGIIDRRGGVAVNPYADKDLLTAALANTPYDYIVAAEQEQEADKDLEKNIDLCFNARSSEAKVTWQQMQTIADTLQTEILSKGGDWEEEWEESEEWDASDFFGVTLPDFHDVDRKFLFSYWKQCFANNQQLFLIFVRAEPTVIGGSSTGHTPSQLGARAVALVWRDPVGIESSTVQGGGNSQKAHKMRILFYHQFE